MNTKFTPGPWGVEWCDVTPCYHIEAGAWPYGTSVCEIKQDPKQGSAQANARLIAAAPELLAIVQKYLDSADKPMGMADIADIDDEARAILERTK